MKLLAAAIVLFSFAMLVMTWGEYESLPWFIALIGWIPHTEK